MKPPPFSYHDPRAIGDVVELLGRLDNAKLLAGGQSLMPVLNMRLSQPKLLIDINRIDALKGISARNGSVRIGALARHVEVMNSPIVARHLPLIAEAMPHLAHVAVRNRGTFGGSLCHADPVRRLRPGRAHSSLWHPTTECGECRGLWPARWCGVRPHGPRHPARRRL